MNLVIEQRHKRLLDMIAEDRLLRGDWQKFDTDGTERACLLVALAPEVADAGTTENCPIEVIPRWLAEITPWINDMGSKEAWPDVVNRYANLIIASRGFSPKEWRKLEATWFLTILKEIRSYNPTAVDHVYRLWQQVAAGNEPKPAEWLEARTEAIGTRKHVTIWAAATITTRVEEKVAIWVAATTTRMEEKETVAMVTWIMNMQQNKGEAKTETADRIISAFFDAWQVILESTQ